MPAKSKAQQKAAGAALSRNASSSPVQFATATIGQAPDVVYALALCLGDVLDSSACGACIADWFATVNQTQCDKAGFSYRDCIVVYGAGADILAAPSNATGASGDNTPPFQDWNIRNVTADDAARIVNLTFELLAKTAAMAADMTASSLTAIATSRPSATTEARMAGSTNGRAMPARARAKPTAMVPTKAAGTPQSALPPICAAQRPTATMARIWSRPNSGCEKPAMMEPCSSGLRCAKAGAVVATSVTSAMGMRLIMLTPVLMPA